VLTILSIEIFYDNGFYSLSDVNWELTMNLLYLFIPSIFYFLIAYYVELKLFKNLGTTDETSVLKT